jgi:hypothetical protein
MFQIRFIELTNIYTKSQTTKLFHTALVRQTIAKLELRVTKKGVTLDTCENKLAQRLV